MAFLHPRHLPQALKYIFIWIALILLNTIHHFFFIVKQLLYWMLTLLNVNYYAYHNASVDIYMKISSISLGNLSNYMKH